MNIYLLTQKSVGGYDTYDSVVVAAESEEAAKLIHADGHSPMDGRHASYSTWPSNPELVSAELIGEAKPETKAGVILASFNAG